jgi:hypothetical protein
MNFLKERNENNESFENLINNQNMKDNEEEEENSPIFTKEFEKIFNTDKNPFESDNDIDLGKGNESIDVMIKTVKANLISLENEINDLNIRRTDLQHVNILNQLNEIYESKNSSLDEKIKALKLQKKLTDKLISWINEKIKEFS